MDTVKLRNGVEMPILGYGVYQVSPSECERCVRDAISVGYRLIDTAQAYGNEQNVGNAIKNCGVPREELFIVTKVWISNAGYERAKASIDESLRKLQTDYIDLLLIHQPFNDYYGTWRAMEEAYKTGKLRAIGVSNFYPDRFIDLAEFSEIPPMVNQVETHVFNQQIEAQQIMEQYGTHILALPHPARRDCHPEVRPQGAYGAELRCVRLHADRRGDAAHPPVGLGAQPVLLALRPADGEMALRLWKK